MPTIPKTQKERLRKLGIRHFDELIHDQPKEWLQRKFSSGATTYPVNVTCLIRNIIWQIRKEHDLSCRQTDQIIDSLFDSMKNELRKKGRVYIRNFGSFSVKKYKARIIKKIQYGTISNVEAREKVSFKPSNNLLANDK